MIVSSIAPALPSWFTPKRLLVVFCVINLINYVDRGAIASNGVNGSLGSCTEGDACTSGTGIQYDKWITFICFYLMLYLPVENGCLSSAFMVGLLVASPIFASLAKMLVVGLSFDFWSIIICRMLVGVGEASFISLAAPFIDDNAPAAQKTVWLAIFYMCIPSGYAFGYVYGGLVGRFVMKPLQLKGFMPAESKEVLTGVETGVSEVQGVLNGKDGSFSMEGDVRYSTIHKQNEVNFTTNIKVQISRFMKDMKVLLVEKVYVVNVLGYIAYNFVIGAYSYWGPKAGYHIYHMTDADLIFGAVSLMLSSFFQQQLGELLVFATQGPVNYICLHCVKPSMRPLAMAMSTVSIHLFGDVPSSPLVGVLEDCINNWRVTALILTSVFIPAAGIWFIGIFLPSVDRFDEESDNDNQITTTERSSTTPLLGGTKTETIESAAEP
ncbi:hypothetical protein M0R45_000426 [Rubus argutus]|uniref:Uncharacterized protein n=1 Tax=Rubus argutus TaxID=59490 RepID=A0AAW1VQD2_RUBAR